MSQSDVMTVEEVAALLKLGIPTIREMIKRGTLPAAKIGKQYRVRRSDVEKLLEPDPASGKKE